MIWVDYVILAVLAISTGIGVFRGFTREALNLATWVLAIWVALAFAGCMADWYAQYVDIPSIQLVLAYATLFLGVLVIGALITHTVSRLVRGTPLSGPDRALGAGFGLLRGGAILVVAVMLGGLTVLREDPWWHQSVLIPRIEPLASWTRERVPASWLDVFRSEAPEPSAEV